MDYVNKFKKEPRLIISAVNLLFFFLPWVSVDVWGFSGSISGFRLISHSFLMFILLLVAIFFLVIPFIPAFENYKKILYLATSLLAIILTFVITSFAAGKYYGIDLSDFGVDIDRGFGFWLSLLAYIGLIAATFIIDFKVSSKSFKEKGFQGVFSDVAGQFTTSAAEIAAGLSQPKADTNISCPSCNSPVAKDTKFCPKCGTQIPEVSKCTGCGAELAAGTVFCSNCGTKSE